MFKRLFVLFLLAIATLSVSTPTHASTLTTNAYCSYSVRENYYCWTTPNGGTGTYSHYYWSMYTFGSSPHQQNFVTSDPWISDYCGYGSVHTVWVTVTDSAGATASASTTLYCDFR